MRRLWSFAGLMLAMGAAAVWAGRVDSVPATSALEELIDSLHTVGSLVLEGRTIQASPTLLAAYERRHFEPIWSRQRDVTDLLRTVHAVSADGLDPDDYHHGPLAALSLLTLDPDRAAALDLLATDAILRLGLDLRFGRARPTDSTEIAEGTDPFGSSDPAGEILDVVASGQLEARLAELRPTHFEYDALVRGLAELKGIERRGGWASIPAGPTMRRDARDVRVPLLRRRLALDGDLRLEGEAPSEPGGIEFDDALEDAVKRFQHRHGLNEDGLVGQRTLAALNVPIEERIDQVRIALERSRRAARDLPDDYVWVNVAGARVYLSRAGRVLFEARVVVGKEETQTPTFSASMSYIEVNPTWTVPRGMVEELLEAVRADPHYLTEREIRLLDATGRAVDPRTLDFSSFTPQSFPYVFHQAPGPTNPLGRIKLIFPNEYAVYLHDSPARWAFAEEERLYSHGCIRVEDPVGLAVEALGEPAKWGREALEDAISRGDTRAIPLKRPLPVFVVYRTVESDRSGTLHFYEDVYERDPPVLETLEAR